MGRIFLCFSWLVFAGHQSLAQEEIDLVTLKNKIIEVRIASGSKSDSLSITNENSKTPILGNWKWISGSAIFRPLIPLPAGKQFKVFRNGKSTDSFGIKPKKQVPPSVLAFYPSSDTLPENLLKCYISFSQPMRDNHIYDLIQISDKRGQIVEDVILHLQPALWNEEQTTLTLWIDPGRVKRDLIRNRNLGIPLKKGNSYTITVSKEWQAINGEKLQFDFRKYFHISGRDEEMPSTNKWNVKIPEAGSTKSLVIEFPESMDYRTTLEGLKIYRDEYEVQGKTSMRDKEKKWVFIPKSKWTTGTYRIEVDPVIEDNAGNNLTRLFDRNVNDNISSTNDE